MAGSRPAARAAETRSFAGDSRLIAASLFGCCACLRAVLASAPLRKQSIPFFSNWRRSPVRVRLCLRGGWGRRAAAVLVVFSTPVAFAANALFPRPLHLVRRVDDPISNTTATIDEYCAGNRVVTIRGSKVAIADYDVQQLTEIDHAALTWSVNSPFVLLVGFLSDVLLP
jgi:hypothetical protein